MGIIRKSNLIEVGNGPQLRHKSLPQGLASSPTTLSFAMYETFQELIYFQRSISPSRCHYKSCRKFWWIILNFKESIRKIRQIQVQIKNLKKIIFWYQNSNICLWCIAQQN